MTTYNQRWCDITITGSDETGWAISRENRAGSACYETINPGKTEEWTIRNIHEIWSWIEQGLYDPKSATNPSTLVQGKEQEKL